MKYWRVERGITRTVLLTRRWAVKVPSLRSYSRNLRGVMWSITRGIQANLSESEWSGTTGVCPVRWSWLGLVNVYPRCVQVSEHELIDWDAIGFLCPIDRKNSNVGWLNGRIVMIDYDVSWNDHPPFCCNRRAVPPVDDEAGES